MPQLIGNYNITSPITEGMPDLQVDSGPGVGRFAGAMAIDVTGGVASQALGAALIPLPPDRKSCHL